MRLTFAENITKRERQVAKRATARAKIFIKEKYPNLSLKGLVVNFIKNEEKRGSRDTAFHYALPGKNPYIDVNVIQIFHIYKLKNCGYWLKETSEDLQPSMFINIACSLIHEITHFHQYKQGRKVLNEIETTLNEVEYLRRYHPAVYKRLKKVK